MVARQAAKGGKAHDPRYRELIAQLIRARGALGLSQEAFAQKLGRHQQFVSRYEIGERRLDIVEFIDIARLLGVPLSVLNDVP